MPYSERDAKAERWDGKDRLVSVGDSLYLNVRQHSKTWLIRRIVHGKRIVRTIGHYPAMSVREARALAIADKLKQDPSNTTIEDLANRYFREVIEPEHRRPYLFRGYLDRAIIPDLGPRRVAEITPTDVAEVIRRYKERGARSADSLRSALKSIFTFSVEIGIRTDNPAGLLTRRVAGYRAESRERVLTDAEIRLVWREEHPNARLLRFLLLTGLRITEAQQGHQARNRWIVPADISKNGKAHWVHLTPSSLAQLPLPACTPTNIQAWVRRWCERHSIEPRFTPHDLRRTAATRMADAGVAPFVIERVLNHTLQGTMAVYNRAEYESERIDAAMRLEKAMLMIGENTAIDADR